MAALSESGKLIRLPWLAERGHRVIMCPVDDALIFGPRGGLESIERSVRSIAEGGPDGILTFSGNISAMPEVFSRIPGIANLSASTTRSQHSRKVQIHSVEHAISVGAAACAFHINLLSRWAGDMISQASHIIADGRRFGLPVLGIVYPRGEKAGSDEDYEPRIGDDPKYFTDCVAQCAALASGLGFDIIKTKFTGTAQSFRSVTEAAAGIPVLIAGGPLTETEAVMGMAREAIKGGATGVSFGRNVFGRENPAEFIRQLRTELSKC